MQYSQKYCLVSFINPIESGVEFSMENWPLHITLAEVFAIDTYQTDIEAKLTKLLSEQSSVETVAKQEVTLGNTKVILLDKCSQLVVLHKALVNLLEKNNAKFNTPEYTREGFMPHCTIQNKEKLHNADKVIIHTVSLIDMYPNKNWKRRRIINNFMLKD